MSFWVPSSPFAALSDKQRGPESHYKDPPANQPKDQGRRTLSKWVHLSHFLAIFADTIIGWYLKEIRNLSFQRGLSLRRIHLYKSEGAPSLPQEIQRRGHTFLCGWLSFTTSRSEGMKENKFKWFSSWTLSPLLLCKFYVPRISLAQDVIMWWTSTFLIFIKMSFILDLFISSFLLQGGV